MKFYLRSAKLEIGDGTTIKTIDDLKIMFTVTKQFTASLNTAEIIVYNLSESSRNQITEEFTKVKLFAGYDNDLPLIFQGDLVNATHLKDQTEWVTTILASDGFKAFKGTINQSLPAGTTMPEAVSIVSDKLEGVTKGVRQGLTNCLSGKKSILRQVQLSGNLKDAFTKLSKTCGFDFSVNDEKFETTSPGQPITDVQPVIINQANGMIGSPERTEIGVNVSVLLTPSLLVGRRIQIKSQTERVNFGNGFFRKIPSIKNEGIYRIQKLVFKGDTRGDTWVTDIVANSFTAS